MSLNHNITIKDCCNLGGLGPGPGACPGGGGPKGLILVEKQKKRSVSVAVSTSLLKEHYCSWYFYVRWLRPGPVLLCAHRDTELRD